DRHRRVVVSSRCRKALAICRTPWFLAASGTMGIVSRRVVVTTDASTKGWGAVCEGRGVNGLWSVTEAASHINVLELRTVVLALRHFLPRLSGQHVLVRADHTSALAYIHCQGGVRSPSLHHWANRLLLCAAVHVRSLRAVHIPSHLNYGADLLSRGNPRAADWCLHPQVVDQIWLRFHKAQIDLFANRQNTCCPLWFSLGGDDPSLGVDALGHQLPNMRLYAFPPVPLLQHVLSRIMDEGRELLLVA